MNGDTLTDVDLPRLADGHGESGALVTLALVPNREFQRYGGVTLDAEGCVSGFVRRGPSAEGSYHYIGVQVVAGRVFDVVEPGTAASSIGGVYDALIAAQPGAVRGAVLRRARSSTSARRPTTGAPRWRSPPPKAPPS